MCRDAWKCVEMHELGGVGGVKLHDKLGNMCRDAWEGMGGWGGVGGEGGW